MAELKILEKKPDPEITKIKMVSTAEIQILNKEGKVVEHFKINPAGQEEKIK